MQGGDATLFTYEMPKFEFKADFDLTLVTIPLGPVPLSIKAFGRFGAGRGSGLRL